MLRYGAVVHGGTSASRPAEGTLEDLLNKRVVLITGKGGVGRTSVTAAAASVAVRRGKRVLVTELVDDHDDYSPLANFYGRRKLPTSIEELAPGINGVALTARAGQEQFLASVLHTSTLAKAALHSDAIRKLLAAAPSFREMGVFFHLLTCLRDTRPDGSPAHELVLVDMPATGHTLALTGLPELLLRLVPRGPIAAALREGQSYLNDPEKAAAWVVTLPETLPVSECLELLEGLKRTSMPAGGIIVNRIPEDPFTAEERAALKPLLSTNHLFGAEGFARVELARREVSRLVTDLKLPLLSVPELRAAAGGFVTSIADALEANGALTALYAGAPQAGGVAR